MSQTIKEHFSVSDACSCVENVRNVLDGIENSSEYELSAAKSMVDFLLKHLRSMGRGSEIDEIIGICRGHGFIPQYQVSGPPSFIPGYPRLSPDSSLVFSNDPSTGGITVIETGYMRPLMTIRVPGTIGFLPSQDSRYLAVRTEETILIWDLFVCRVVYTASTRSGAMCWQGDLFAYCRENEVVEVHMPDAEECRLFDTINDHPFVIALSEDGREVLVIGRSGVTIAGDEERKIDISLDADSTVYPCGGGFSVLSGGRMIRISDGSLEVCQLPTGPIINRDRVEDLRYPLKLGYSGSQPVLTRGTDEALSFHIGIGPSGPDFTSSSYGTNRSREQRDIGENIRRKIKDRYPYNQDDILDALKKYGSCAYVSVDACAIIKLAIVETKGQNIKADRFLFELDRRLPVQGYSLLSRDLERQLPDVPMSGRSEWKESVLYSNLFLRDAGMLAISSDRFVFVDPTYLPLLNTISDGRTYCAIFDCRNGEIMFSSTTGVQGSVAGRRIHSVTPWTEFIRTEDGILIIGSDGETTTISLDPKESVEQAGCMGGTTVLRLNGGSRGLIVRGDKSTEIPFKLPSSFIMLDGSHVAYLDHDSGSVVTVSLSDGSVQELPYGPNGIRCWFALGCSKRGIVSLATVEGKDTVRTAELNMRTGEFRQIDTLIGIETPSDVRYNLVDLLDIRDKRTVTRSFVNGCCRLCTNIRGKPSGPCLIPDVAKVHARPMSLSGDRYLIATTEEDSEGDRHAVMRVMDASKGSNVMVPGSKRIEMRGVKGETLTVGSKVFLTNSGRAIICQFESGRICSWDVTSGRRYPVGRALYGKIVSWDEDGTLEVLMTDQDGRFDRISVMDWKLEEAAGYPREMDLGTVFSYNEFRIDTDNTWFWGDNSRGTAKRTTIPVRSIVKVKGWRETERPEIPPYSRPEEADAYASVDLEVYEFHNGSLTNPAEVTVVVPVVVPVESDMMTDFGVTEMVMRSTVVASRDGMHVVQQLMGDPTKLAPFELRYRLLVWQDGEWNEIDDVPCPSGWQDNFDRRCVASVGGGFCAFVEESGPERHLTLYSHGSPQRCVPLEGFVDAYPVYADAEMAIVSDCDGLHRTDWRTFEDIEGARVYGHLHRVMTEHGAAMEDDAGRRYVISARGLTEDAGNPNACVLQSGTMVNDHGVFTLELVNGRL